MQRTGSFKERGALCRLLRLSQAERERGVVTASAGNHAQAVAYHATRLGIASTIFMPRGTPLIKLTRTEGYGANVILEGDNFDDAQEAAMAFMRQENAVYIHPYDDQAVILGQATIGLEIIEQLPEVDVVVVAVGGGGLIAGIAQAIHLKKPGCRIIGIEPESLPSMAKALEAHHPVTLKPAQTLADGIRVRRVGNLTFELCEKNVPEWYTVSDDQIAKAILFLLENQKIVAEGAGAAGVAALLSGRVSDLKGKNICVVVGGGNIDAHLIARVIERGMTESGRMMQLSVRMKDQPGELAKLLGVISSMGANVLEVHHERAFAETNWDEVVVDLVLQTRGHSNRHEIGGQLSQMGYQVV